MAVANGSNRALFLTQSIGLSASGSVSLLLTHNLGESPMVSFIYSTLTISPGIVAVVTINGSQVGLVSGGANSSISVGHVVCDRWYTPTQ